MLKKREMIFLLCAASAMFSKNKVGWLFLSSEVFWTDLFCQFLILDSIFFLIFLIKY
jgi:hypothetical protein